MGSTVTNSVTSLFLILLVGVYGRKKEIINQEINKGLTNILINITLPLLIISSFMIDFDIEMKKNVYQTFFFSLITFGITLMISKVLVIPIKGNKRNILNFSNIFTNTGFIGFPLLNAVLGPEGVVYGSTYNIIFNIFVWTYGLMIYKGRNQASSIKDKVLDIFKQPTIIAVLIGLTIMIFSIKIPPVIFTSIKLVGDITGPLSMIVVGVSLLNINFKKYFKDWTIYYGIVIKLLLMPIIVIFLFKLIGVWSLFVNSIILQVAMPTATLASIFAEKYNYELEYSTIMVVTTTLFSVVTIPLIVGILQYIN